MLFTMVDKHIRRVRSSLPKEGSVRTLQVTDKQYGRMELMLGAAPKTEQVGPSQMVLLCFRRSSSAKITAVPIPYCRVILPWANR